MNDWLAKLAESGLLAPLDVHAARSWARVAGETREDVLLAAALASRAVAIGHVCLDLGRAADVAGEAFEGEAPPVAIAWPEPAAWRAALASSALVHGEAEARAAAPEATRPLVLDGADRLYLHRYFEHQARLAAAIRARLGRAPATGLDEAALAEGLARLFPAAAVTPAGDTTANEPDGQRLAAEGALRSAFFVISGGPGTGKTSTVVKILALLIEQALARGAAPPRILLLAPTGKAAAQLQDSVARQVAALPCSDAVRATIPAEASTIHRALGAGGTPMRYRRDGDRPLEADVVLVDEASMVDLALMSHLVAALPAEARLILLGDRDQLASVEAGAVLGDIAGAGAPSEAGAAPAARAVAVLHKSYRFDAASGVGALVRAIHAGDAERVLALCDDPSLASVRRIEPGDARALGVELRAGYAEFAAATTPTLRLRALDRFRVLCAHRHGRFGVGAHNRLVESLLAEAGALEPRGEWYDGRPVLIARNDYAARLWNGDIGLVARRADSEGRDASPAALGVLFRSADGERWLSPRRIAAAETVFAMSVHKSQGSELDRVLVVLPDAPSPIVSRELLYTAVSRARSEVCLCATRDAIQGALARRVVRASGLREAVWG